MSALTDFLLARIGEDEADWAERHTFGCAWTNPCYEPPYEAGPDPALCDCRVKRAMADLEAKRRIVETYLELDAQIRQVALSEPDFANGVRMTRFGVGLTLGALASVYADHPDYDPCVGGTVRLVTRA